jgi:hypothetical protein
VRSLVVALLPRICVVNLVANVFVDEWELEVFCILFLHDGEDVVLDVFNKKVHRVWFFHVDRGGYQFLSAFALSGAAKGLI